MTPIIFLAFTVWMTVWSIQTQPTATIAGVLTLAGGYGVYLLRARQMGAIPRTLRRRNDRGDLNRRHSWHSN